MKIVARSVVIVLSKLVIQYLWKQIQHQAKTTNGENCTTKLLREKDHDKVVFFVV